MKHLIYALSLLILLVMACSLNTKTLRPAKLPHVPINYEILGDTIAEESRISVVYVDWSHLFSDQQGNIEGLETVEGIFSGIIGSAQKAALYKALQKIPEADKLIEPRWEIEEFSVGVYSSVTVKVRAKAIKYTRSAPITISSQAPRNYSNSSSTRR